MLDILWATILWLAGGLVVAFLLVLWTLFILAIVELIRLDPTEKEKRNGRL